MIVLKRSGKTEQLTKKKIYDSICNANSAVTLDENKLTQKQLKRISDSVYEMCLSIEEEPLHIDALEDIIEKKLMEAQGYEVAKRYITYRYEKERSQRRSPCLPSKIST